MTHHLTLPNELTIYTVCECAAAWRDVLHALPATDADTHTLDVDAASVSEIDGAGVQLLISLHHSAHAKGRTLVLHAPTDAVQHACRRLGAHALLNPALQEATA